MAFMNDVNSMIGAAQTSELNYRVTPLLERWYHRRREALGALDTAFRLNSPNGVAAEELASLMHKLSGTAGLFGETELGHAAARLERALRERDDGSYAALVTEIRALASTRTA